MIDTTEFNRIRIKDLFSAIRNDRTINNEIQLLYIEMLNQREKRLLEKASEDDVRIAEKLFIEEKLKIKYYPSQDKKVLGNGKIVSIEKMYG